MSSSHKSSDESWMPPVVRGTLVDQVLHALALLVVRGDISAGDTLPPETELAARFGVSKPTARETLKRLQGLGLVEIAHGKRTIVNPLSEWDVLSETVAQAFRDAGRGAELEAQYWQLRRIVERAAARLAAENASTPEREHLLGVTDLMQRAHEDDADIDEIRRLDQDFHDLIGQASRNYALRRVSVPVYAFLLWLRRLTSESVETMIIHHRGIASAIAAGDVQGAEAAMEEHIAWSEAVNVAARANPGPVSDGGGNALRPESPVEVG